MTPRENHPPPAGESDKPLPARSAELLEIVPCALMEVAIDGDGRRAVTYFSTQAREMYGYDRLDVLGRDPVFLSASSPSEISRWRASFNESGRWHRTDRHITKDGRTIDVELDGLAWRDEAGRFGGYLMAIRDITTETKRSRSSTSSRRCSNSRPTRSSPATCSGGSRCGTAPRRRCTATRAAR